MKTLKRTTKALTTLNNKLLENDRGIIASFLLSLLFKITNPENTSQLNVVKDSISNRVNYLLIHNTIPVTFYDNFVIFRDTNKELELEGSFFYKMMTNKKYNVDLACSSDKKLLYDFAKEMHFDKIASGSK